MPDAAVLAPLALAAVLMLSGIAKLRDPESTQSVVRLLRLPRWLWGRWFAVVLPVGELVLAVCLLIPWLPLFTVAAVATVLLCLSYWAVIARAMTFDPRPSCGCFGRIGDQRVSARTLVRNTLLIATSVVALALALDGGTTSTALRTGSTWSWLAGCTVVAALAVLVLTSPAGRPTRSRADHPDGDADDQTGPEQLDYIRAPIPAAVLQQPDGAVVTMAELAAERPQLLVAVNCTCGSTHDAMSKLDDWRSRLPILDVRLMSTVDLKVLAAAVDHDQVEGALYDHRGVAWRALGMESSPAAVLLGADGQLAGGPVSGGPQVEQFVTDIEAELAEMAQAQGPSVVEADR